MLLSLTVSLTNFTNVNNPWMNNVYASILPEKLIYQMHVIIILLTFSDWLNLKKWQNIFRQELAELNLISECKMTNFETRCNEKSFRGAFTWKIWTSKSQQNVIPIFCCPSTYWVSTKVSARKEEKNLTSRYLIQNNQLNAFLLMACHCSLPISPH